MIFSKKVKFLEMFSAHIDSTFFDPLWKIGSKNHFFSLKVGDDETKLSSWKFFFLLKMFLWSPGLQFWPWNRIFFGEKSEISPSKIEKDKKIHHFFHFFSANGFLAALTKLFWQHRGSFFATSKKLLRSMSEQEGNTVSSKKSSLEKFVWNSCRKSEIFWIKILDRRNEYHCIKKFSQDPGKRGKNFLINILWTGKLEFWQPCWIVFNVNPNYFPREAENVWKKLSKK